MIDQASDINTDNNINPPVPESTPKYDFGASIVAGNNIPTINQHLQEFQVEPYLRSKEDFIATNKLDKIIGNHLYENVVKPSYLALQQGNFDMYATNKRFFPDTENFRNRGLPTWRGNQYMPISKTETMIGGNLVEGTSLDRVADNNGYLISKLGEKVPLSMAKDYNYLKLVKTNDAREAYWQEKDDTWSPSDGETIRGAAGAKDLFTENSWYQRILPNIGGSIAAIGAQSWGYLLDLTDRVLAAGSYISPYGIGEDNPLTRAVKENKVSNYAKVNPKMTPAQVRQYESKLDDGTVGTQYYTSGKYWQPGNYDEQTLDTWTGINAALWQGVGQMVPTIAIGMTTAGLGLIPGMSSTALTAASNIGVQASLLQMSLGAAGAAKQQLMDWGEDESTAMFYGGLIGMTEYIAENTFSANLAQRIGFKTHNKAVIGAAEEILGDEAKKQGVKTIIELSTETKVNALQKAMRKVAGLNDKLVALGEKGILGRSAGAFLEEGAESYLSNIYQAPIQSFYEYSKKSISEENQKRYDGVQWETDENDKFYRTERNGVRYEIPEEQWLAEQRDYRMANDILSGNGPYSSNDESWFKQALLEGASALITSMPMHLMSYHQKDQKEAHMARLVKASLESDRSYNDIVNLIDKLTFGEPYVTRDGKPITVPSTKKNQVELDKKEEDLKTNNYNKQDELDKKYKQDIINAPTEEAKVELTKTYEESTKVLQNEYDKELEAFRAERDNSEDDVSINDAMKTSFKETLDHQIFLAKKYANLTPGQLAAAGGNINLLKETFRAYGKLEQIDKSIEEFAKDNKVITEIPNIIGNEGITTNTTLQQLNEFRDRIIKQVREYTAPKQNGKFSEAYSRLYARSGAYDEATIEVAKENIKLKNIEESDPKYKAALDKEILRLQTKRLTGLDAMNLLFKTSKYGDPLSLFEGMSDILFSKKKSSFMSMFIDKHNAKVDAINQKISEFPDSLKTLKTQMQSVMDNAKTGGAFLESRKSGTRNLNVFNAGKNINQTIDIIRKTLNEGSISEELQQQLSELSDMQVEYNQTIEDANIALQEINKAQEEINPGQVGISDDFTAQLGELNHKTMQSLNPEEILKTNKPLEKYSIDDIKPEQEETLRRKALEEFLSRDMLGQPGFQAYFDFVKQNIDAFPQPEIVQNNLDNLKEDLDVLFSYGNLNKNLFQDKMNTKDTEEHSPLRNKTLERLSEEDKQYLDEQKQKLYKSFDEVYSLIGEKTLSRGLGQKKFKAVDFEIHMKCAVDILKGAKDLDDSTVSEVETLLKSINDEIKAVLGPKATYAEFIRYYNDTSNIEKTKEVDKLLQLIYKKDIQLRNLIGKLNSRGQLTTFMYKLKDKMDDDGNYYYQNKFGSLKAFNTKDPSRGEYNGTNYSNPNKSQLRDYILLQFLNMYKDGGNEVDTKDGKKVRKTVNELYNIILDVQEERQAKGDSENNVLTYQQEQVLLQMLINFDREGVFGKNITADKDLAEYSYPWSMLVDGYAGVGKSTVIIQDYIASLSRILGSPVNYMVISPTEALLKTYEDNNELIEGQYNPKTYNQILLDEFLNSNQDTKDYDFIIIDEYSALTKSDVIGPNSIKEKLKDFKGQILFLGDDGQVSSETHGDDGKELKESQIMVNSVYPPALNAGEKSMFPLQESFRNGDVLLSEVGDYFRSIRAMYTEFSARWKDTKLEESYGRRKSDGRMYGVKLTSSNEITNTTNAIYEDYIKIYNELFALGRTSPGDIMLILKNTKSIEDFKEYIKEHAKLDDVTKQTILANVKTAIYDKANPSYFVSGLKTNNSFIFIDFSDAKLDTYDKSLYVSRLMTAPVSRTNTGGYTNIYMSILNPDTYLNPHEEKIDSEGITKYEDFKENKQNLRAEYIDSLRDVVGKEAVKPPRKPKPPRGNFDSIQNLSLTKEQQEALINSSEYKKAYKSITKLVRTYTNRVYAEREINGKVIKASEQARKDFDVLMFINETLGERMTPKSRESILKQLEAVRVAYNDAMKQEGSTTTDMGNINGRSIVNPELAVILDRATIIPHVTVNLKEGTGEREVTISFVDVVGKDTNGKLIVDIYRVSNYHDEAGKISATRELQTAKLGVQLIKDNPDLILNRARMINIFRKTGKDVYVHSIIDASNDSIVDANNLIGNLTEFRIESDKDMFGGVITMKNGEQQPIQRIDPIYTEERHIAKIIDGVKYFPEARIYQMDANGEIKMMYRMKIPKSINSIIVSEQDYIDAEDSFDKKHKYFEESAELNERGVLVSTSHIIPIGFGSVSSPMGELISKLIGDAKNGLYQSNAYGALKLTLIKNITNKTKVRKFYVPSALFHGQGEFKHVIFNKFTEEFITKENIDEIHKAVNNLAIALGVKPVTKDIISIYAFLQETHLDIISNDFRPEINYGEDSSERLLSDDLISEYIKDTTAPSRRNEILKMIAFDGSKTSGMDALNNEYNAAKLERIRQLSKMDSNGIMVAVHEVRFGAETKISDTTKDDYIQTIIDNVKNNYGIELQVQSVEMKYTEEGYGKVSFEVTMISKNNEVSPVVISMDAKKATVGYIDELIEEISNFNTDLKLVVDPNAKKEESNEDLIYRVYQNMDKLEAAKFLEANTAQIVKTPTIDAMTNSFLSIDRKSKVHVDHFSIESKKANIIEALKQIKEFQATQDGNIFFMVVNRTDNKTYETKNLIPSKETDMFNAPQILTDSKEVVSKRNRGTKTTTTATTKTKAKTETNTPEPETNDGTFKAKPPTDDFDFSYVKKPGEKISFDHTETEITAIVNSIIGNASNFKLELSDDINTNKDLLGKFLHILKELPNNRSTILLRSMDGKYSEDVARHEAMHFITILMLSPKQRLSIEKEVSKILLSNGKEVNNINIYEYIADAYMNKESIPRMSLLARFVAWVKGMVNKWFQMNINLSELYYFADKGIFMDAKIYEYDKNVELLKSIENDLNDEESQKLLKETLITEQRINQLTSKIIPSLVRRNTIYTTNLNSQNKTVSDVFISVKQYFANESKLMETVLIRGKEITREKTVTIKGKKVALAEVKNGEDFDRLSNADKNLVISKRLTNPEVIDILLQKVFNDMDVSEILSGEEANGGETSSSFSETDRMTQLSSTTFDLMLATIPRALKSKYGTGDVFADRYNQFVSIDLVKVILHHAVERLRLKAKTFNTDDFVNEFELMSKEFSNSELKNVAFSMFVEFGNFYSYKKTTQGGGELAAHKDNIADSVMGITYFLNNMDKIAEQMDSEFNEETKEVEYTGDDNTTNEHYEFLEEKAEYLRNVLSKLFTSTISTNESIVSYVDFSDKNRPRVTEITGSDVAMSFAFMRNEMIEELYDEDELKPNIVEMLVGDKAVYKSSGGTVERIDSNGIYTTMLQYDTPSNPEDVVEILKFLGIKSATIDFAEGFKGAQLTNIVINMMTSLYVGAKITNMYSEFLVDNELELAKQIKIAEIEATKSNKDTAEGIAEDALIDLEIDKIIADDNDEIEKEFTTYFKANEDLELKQLRQQIAEDYSQGKYGHAKSFLDNSTVSIPSPFDRYKEVKVLAGKMLAIDVNIKNSQIRTPEGEWLPQYVRTSPLYSLMLNGGNILRSKIQAALDKNIIDVNGNFNTSNKALKNNLFATGTFDYDLLQSSIGALSEYSSGNMSQMSIKDFMKSWIDGLLTKEINYNSGITKFPIFFDNFSDKSKVPYIGLFYNKKGTATSLLNYKKKGQNVSDIYITPEAIIESFDQAVEWYKNRQKKSIDILKSIVKTTNLSKLSYEQKVALKTSTIAVLGRDYIIKGKGTDLNALTFEAGPAVTLNHKESIYTDKFIKKYTSSTNKMDVIMNAMSDDISEFAKLISDSEYILPTTFSKMSEGRMITNDEGKRVYESYTKIDDEFKKQYNDLFSEYLKQYYDKHTTEERKIISDLTYDERKALALKIEIEFPEYKKAKFVIKSAVERKQKKESKNITENNFMISTEENGVIVDKVHPLITTLFMGFHIFNTQAQQLYKGDEYFYKDVTDFVKRAAGDVSPINKFDTTVKNGVGDKIRFITADDIPGTHQFVGKSEADLETNGYSKMTPWFRKQLKISDGGELGNIGNGTLKTTLKEYDMSTDMVTYLKFSQGLMNEWEYRNDQFSRNLIRHCLTSGEKTSVVLKDTKEEVNIFEHFKELINPRNNTWDIGIDKFNKFLHQEIEGGGIVKDHTADFVTFPSAFKSGLRGVNLLQKDEKTGAYDIVGKATITTVSSENYGLQIIKKHPTESSDKTAGVQNLRMYGLGMQNAIYASEVNATLSKILNVIIDEIDAVKSGKKNTSSENLIKYIRDISRENSYNEDTSLKIRTLITDSNIKLDVQKDKHIQHLLVHLNKYLKPYMTGNTYVQVPTQMRFNIDKSGIFRTQSESGEDNIPTGVLRPMTFHTKSIQGEYSEILTKAEYDAMSDTDKANIKVKPADVVMEFHKRKEFGIPKGMTLYHVTHSNDRSINMYDPWHTEYTFEERKAYLDKKLADKSVDEILSTFDNRLIPEFKRRIGYWQINNPGKEISVDNVIAIIANYYTDFNKALYTFTDRIPHSGFNNGQMGRIVAFAEGLENTIIMSSEKNILDGSDYDIDELHTFFQTIESVRPKARRNRIKYNTITAQENSLFSTIKNSYLDPKNIDLFTMQIDLQTLRDKAEKNESKYFFNSLTTRMNKMRDGYSGRNLVGHFVTIQNALSVLNATKSVMFSPFADDAGVDKVKMEKAFPSKFRLLYADQRYIRQFIDFNQKLINAATDNSKEDGIIGKLGIIDGNTEFVAGLMLSMNAMNDADINKSITDGTFNLEDYVLDYMMDPIIRKATQIHANKKSITANQKGEFDLSLDAAFTYFKSEINKNTEIEFNKIDSKDEVNRNKIIEKGQADIEVLKKKIKQFKDVYYMGAALRMYYSFDFLGGIKPDEWTLYNTLNNVEKNLGTSIDSFFDPIKIEGYQKDGISVKDQMDYVKNSKDTSTSEEHERGIRKQLNIPLLISNNPLYSNYIKTIKSVNDIVTQSFATNYTPVRSKFLAMQNMKSITNEDRFKALSTEIEKTMIGYYADHISPIMFENVKYNMSDNNDRDALILKTNDIIAYLKEKYVTNELVSSLRVNKSKAGYPIVEIKNSRYYSSIFKNELAQEFTRLQEKDKHILRTISLLLYGFNNPNGAITEFIDDVNERGFSEKFDTIITDIAKEKNILANAENIAINNYALQSVYSSLFKRAGKYNERGRIVTTKNYKGNRDNNIFRVVDGDTMPIALTPLYHDRINTYSKNSVAYRGKRLKGISYESLKLARNKNVGESMDIRIPKALTFAPPSVDSNQFPTWIKNGDRVALENGVIGSVVRSGNHTIFTKEGLFDGKSETQIKANYSNTRSTRIAGDLVEHIVDKLKMMFPNVNIEIVNNFNTMHKGLIGYVYNGKVYLNSDLLTSDTPLHEMGHIVTEVLKYANKGLFESLRQNAIELLRDNEMLRNYVAKHYGSLSAENQLMEVISLMIGWNTERKIEAALNAMGDSTLKAKSWYTKIKDAVLAAYREFVKMVSKLLLGRSVNISGISNLEQITISQLSDILFNAYAKGEVLSTISTSTLKKIMMANNENMSIIKANVDTNTNSLIGLIPKLHGTNGVSSMFANLENQQLIEEIYTSAIANNGEVTIMGQKYNLNDIELGGKDQTTEWKKHIANNIIKDISISKDLYVDKVLNWLNKSKGSIHELGVFGISDGVNFSKQPFQKFLKAINYDPLKTYVRYSDLKTMKGFENIYNEALVGFNPIVSIDKTTGQNIISIYDVSPSMYNSQTVIGENRSSILKNYINNFSAKTMGILLTNEIQSVKQLYIQLMINDIHSKSDNIIVDKSSVIMFNRGETKVYYLDGALISQTIEGMKSIPKFMDELSPELQKAFENENVDVAIDYDEFLNNWYSNHTYERDAWITKNGITIANPEGDLIKKREMIMSRLDFLSNKIGYESLSQTHMNEIDMLVGYYNALFVNKIKNGQINKIDILNKIDQLIKPTMNMGQEDFQFIRDVITQGSNEVVAKLQKFKDVFQGTDKVPGIVRRLQDNYSAVHSEYGVEKYLKENEYKVYEQMYAKETDTKGVERKTGFLLWTTDETEDPIYFNQASKLDSKTLDEARKIVQLVEDLLVERVQHNYWKHTGYNNLSKEKALLRLKTNSTYRKGMIPMMSEKSAEAFYKNLNLKDTFDLSTTEFVNSFSTFDSNYSPKKNEALGLIETIDDMFLHQFEYHYEGLNPDIAITRTPIGTEVRLEMLGLKPVNVIDKNGNSDIKFETQDPSKNEKLSTNLQTSMLYFALTGIRKEIYEKQVLPIVNGAFILMKDLNENKDVKALDPEKIQKVVQMYANSVIHGKNTIDDQKTGLDTAYNIANRTLTPLVMFGNMSVPAISLMANTMSSFFNGLGSQFSETGEPTIVDLAKASAIVIKDFARVSQWAYEYQIVNASEMESITHRWRGVVGERYVANQFITNYLNWGTDFYAKAVAMVGQMIHDGSWDAHQYDETTGRTVYKEELDKKFQGEEGAVLRKYYQEKLSLENGINDDGTFTRGYFFKAAKSMKAYADRKIIGAYSTEVKALIGQYMLGKWFGKFATWMFAFYDATFGKGQYVTEGGRVVVTKDKKTGELMASWEQMYFEGWMRTYFDIIKKTIVTGNFKEWSKLNKVQKANLFKGAVIFAVFSAMTVAIELGTDDDEKKKIKSAEGLDWMLVRSAQQAVRSSLLFPDLFQKIQNPFALIGLGKRNLDNLYLMFFNKEGTVDYDRIQRMIPATRINEYVSTETE